LPAHVGKISYGIYLLHMFVISAVKKLPGGTEPWVCFALSTALVIPFASVVYRCFEEPIIRYYKKRFAAPAPSSPAPESAIVAAPVRSSIPG
jgi:peptidoglycan/LPS O-acetylase OafA/YrhL